MESSSGRAVTANLSILGWTWRRDVKGGDVTWDSDGSSGSISDFSGSEESCGWESC